MSGKLFLQIVALMLIFIVLMTAVKCLKKAYCGMGKAKTCTMCARKAGR